VFEDESSKKEDSVIDGVVNSIIFNRESYYILSLDAGTGRPVKAKGNLYGLDTVYEGIPIRLVGKWTRNKRYGDAFSFRTWDYLSTPNLQEIVLFLRCIDGLADYRVVSLIAERYKASTFDALSEKVSEISDLANNVVTREALNGATLAWDLALQRRDLSVLLRDGGLSPTETQAAMIRFGSEAPRVILENPYRLTEIGFLPFARVDRVALHLGVALSDPRRVQGAVLWALQEGSRRGHLYLGRTGLSRILETLPRQEEVEPLEYTPDEKGAIDAAVKALSRQKAVTIDRAGLYLNDLYKYERETAKHLVSLVTSSTIKVDLDPFLVAYEKSHMTLSASQRQAVETLAREHVLVITGLPGTGKTQTTRAIVHLLEEAKLNVKLMAPTGIAAKRLSAMTGRPASTVHRALGYDGESWGFNAFRRYTADAVILDEMSMVDQELLYRLLVALHPGTRLILVGDDAQLPSVGPGHVLCELLRCSKIPQVRLTEVFRQSVKGEIVSAAHAIHGGQLPNLQQATTSEFRFKPLESEDAILKLIVSMAVKLKNQHANFQILSPKYKGTIGVDSLNMSLRDALNPEGPPEYKHGATRFREGDRVMVIANDYRLNVYNGDVGTLRTIGRDGTMSVRIHDTNPDGPVFLVDFEPHEAAKKLKLAYAVTVHRCQGSEFDHIILPIMPSQGIMLQRNLLYTAVTRARKRVWLIGSVQAVQRAVDNNQVVNRNTVLSSVLESALTGVVSSGEPRAN
jgi:exodeoxyribonuclease V alpha subunit